MKVVLFCGGRGTRLRDYSEKIPKPMVTVGYRPVMWHVMKYYAHFGHKEFILCLGHGAQAIKDFFLHYEEAESNDFVLKNGGRDKVLLNSDIDDWTITFVDTGLKAEIGERLRVVEPYIGDDEVFLANYSDGLTDLDLDSYVEGFLESDRIASFVAVKPPQSYHVATFGSDHLVSAMSPITSTDLWINGGYFIFRRSIFEYIKPEEDLVREPFDRLIAREQLLAHPYTGFWAPMDTFKDKQHLDDLFASGEAPWEVWKQAPRP
ncbi:MAG TPA: glucose-1-phosphate cytidylyltransferase [Actinobacteria bacterium]|nr:glucose-1-phosphate cytidylyltransferase [bacterium BMS3Bbin01]HDH25510.1 glucose-1-phosphate cytidylyltransferase [Actinomycetota bacterium]